MKRLFCVFTLMFIAFIINADMYYDPNYYFDHDSQTSGRHYASAYTSECLSTETNTYWYSATASASYSDEEGWEGDAAYWSLSVDATSMVSDSDSGVTWPGGSKYMSIYGGHMHEQSWASSYSSMGSACAYAGI